MQAASKTIKISIITVNYNNAEGLRHTLGSTRSQTFSGFEHIVIDGGSTDDSIRVIKENVAGITSWISEPDRGVYEAMNKGIRKAQGQYVLFLNSGDTFVDPHVLKKVLPKLKDKELYYGNLVFSSKDNKFIQEYPSTLNFEHFLTRSLPHPGTFISRTLFDQLFYYSETYSIVSDWEFFIVAVCKEGVSYEHLEETIAVFDLQGMSNNPANKARIHEERAQVLAKHFKEWWRERGATWKQQNEVPSKKPGKAMTPLWKRVVAWTQTNKSASHDS